MIDRIASLAIRIGKLEKAIGELQIKLNEVIDENTSKRKNRRSYLPNKKKP